MLINKISFGQYNKPYYEYGNQRSINKKYVQSNKNTKAIAGLSLGFICLILGLLHKNKIF